MILDFFTSLWVTVHSNLNSLMPIFAEFLVFSNKVCYNLPQNLEW